MVSSMHKYTLYVYLATHLIENVWLLIFNIDDDDDDWALFAFETLLIN